jgi:hypothetical protein
VKLTERDRRALVLLAAAVVAILILRFGFFQNGQAKVVPTSDSIPAAERRLAKLRQIAATVPGKQAVYGQVRAELASRERGVITADTAAQAQAQLLQVVRRIGKEEGIDVRGGEFGAVRALGEEYGEVSAAVSFECPIEKLVNFLAALTKESQLLATNEIRTGVANVKEKTVTVRLALAGVVPRKLAPEKKGIASF